METIKMQYVRRRFGNSRKLLLKMRITPLRTMAVRLECGMVYIYSRGLDSDCLTRFLRM